MCDVLLHEASCVTVSVSFVRCVLVTFHSLTNDVYAVYFLAALPEQCYDSFILCLNHGAFKFLTAFVVF